jgi:hypothetical protein
MFNLHHHLQGVYILKGNFALDLKYLSYKFLIKDKNAYDTPSEDVLISPKHDGVLTAYN